MGGVRENCRWIPSPIAASSEFGIHVEPFDNPDLLKALSSLAKYVDWVDSVVIPVASKWIEEHREEVISGMTEEETNDIGAAMARAFAVVKDSDWYKQQVARSLSYDFETAGVAGKANPLWARASKT
jgi:hypothetical protein